MILEERRAAYYMWNIGLPNFLLSLLVFTSFAIERQDLADRLSVTLTLVLTSVAFKYMVSQELPRISYLTLLDVYVLVSFTFLALVGGQNAFSSLLSDGFELASRRLVIASRRRFPRQAVACV